MFERKQFRPEYIYNVDEIGCTTVQKIGKLIATKGIKQVGKIMSQERGTLVTMCIAIKSGWMCDDTFLTFIKHFTKFVKTSIESPVLLLLENHSSQLSLKINLRRGQLLIGR